jgi:hypothetical protein
VARDLNVKYQFWNSVISEISGAKLLDSLHIKKFVISAPQYVTHYSPAGNGVVLDIFVHKNVRLSEVIASDIPKSNHLPFV